MKAIERGKAYLPQNPMWELIDKHDVMMSKKTGETWLGVVRMSQTERPRSDWLETFILSLPEPVGAK